ncbi:EsV-1-178 [Ectocarpus siliculosus virus 1]|uniref:EsV-1-178 n=1 Tax=Ectocarpus siliculosus virus 1 (isolate New Zealand/Kaikoura/1988) TaxID=654926 RepID=Q8QNA9_ESV1K|nr:EsV-1-178 [Ectocarpus siliculosus virus 1]AAK14592.1 EsV-1-178 [Ectocarpus siliculosus virus 1]
MEVDTESPEPRTKKRCTRKSGVEQSLHAEGDEESSSTRRSCICLDLERTLVKSVIPKYIRDRLERMSRYTGSFRYIVGLFSNYVVIRRLEQGLQPPEVKKVFYDRCWAAINTRISGKNTRNDFSDLLDEFIDQTGFDTSLFPPRVPSRLQETVTREMEVSAKNSIVVHLEAKIKGFLRFRLMNDSQLAFQHLPAKDRSRIIISLSNDCLEREMRGDLDPGYVPHVLQVRDLLAQVYSTEPDVSVLKVLKKKPHLFLELISMISNVAEEASDNNRDLREETKTRSDEEKVRKAFYMSERIKRGLVDRPKMCTVLPVWKLAPCFPYYSSSVVGSTFHKEGHDFSSVSRFISEHFDLGRVNRKGYKPSGFRSDGYQVQVTFMTLVSKKPLVPGTKDLAKSGYQIAKKVVSLETQERGLFVLSQARKDSRKIVADRLHAYNLTVVDPGCASVVSVRSCPLEFCRCVGSVREKSTDWEMKGTEYSAKSGRTMLEGREKKRRSNDEYGRCFPRFSAVKKKTARKSSFVAYCRVAAETFKVMFAEKMKRARKRSRFHSSRLVQKTVDKLASSMAACPSDRKNIVLFGNGSFRAKKGHASAPRKKLVRAICSRVNVGMLDEFRTSKMCPGGCGGEMTDVQGGQRVRQCTTVSVGVENPCPLFENAVAFRYDRDASATLNFCLAGYCGLVRKSWPTHLLRGQ